MTVIHDYLISLSNTLEDNEPELRGQTTVCETGAAPSCPCATCRDDTEEAAFWTNETYTLASATAAGKDLLSFDYSTVSLTLASSRAGFRDTPDGILEECLSGYLENAFLRVAAREASISTRIGYEYAAFQAVGNYVQWPAIDWCSSSYDPRFRSWYVSAASGPKDVVIVLDVSGSMRVEGRMSLMREAALKLLDTFTSVDYVAVISFSNLITKGLGATRLVPATDANLAALKEFVSGLSSGGTTNYRGAFAEALSLLENSNGVSGASSSCTKAILFLSDGEPDEFLDTDYASVAATAEQLGGVQIFTYALGSGASTDYLKKIACRNDGAMWVVPDGGNLGDAMADYYTFLAPLQQTCQVRWTYYNDWSSGASLLAACLASFKKDARSDETSCSEGSQGCMPEMLGVVCMDVSLIATQAMIEAVGATSFYDRVDADRTSCLRRTATPEQLQALRARIDTAFGDAVCSAADLAVDAAPAPISCEGDSAASPPSSPGGTTGGGSDGGADSGAESDGGGRVGAIVGITAGVAVVVVLLVANLVCMKRRTPAYQPTQNAARNSAARPAAAVGAFPATSSAYAQPVAGPPPVVVAVPVGSPEPQGGVQMGYPTVPGRYPSY